MSGSRLVLIGNGTAAVVALRELRALGADIPLILADPHDTGADGWRLSLVGEALRCGYEAGRNLLAPRDPNEPAVLERISAAAADLVLSVQCARILRRPMLGLARHGVANLHHAPLPLLRGCDPFAWAIHDGLLEMGVTLHRIVDEGVDNGPVFASRRWPIGDDASAWDLYLRTLDEDAVLVREAVPGIAAGIIPAVPQDSRHVTYHPMGQFVFGELEIDWTRIAATLGAWIRARIFPPFQLPYFTSGGVRVEVLRCRAGGRRGVPGTVLAADPLVVAARWGSIELMELRADGEAMNGAAWAGQFGLRPGAQVGKAAS